MHPEQRLIDRLRCIPSGTMVHTRNVKPSGPYAVKLFQPGGWYLLNIPGCFGFVVHHKSLTIERTYHGTRTS